MIFLSIYLTIIFACFLFFVLFFTRSNVFPLEDFVWPQVMQHDFFDDHLKCLVIMTLERNLLVLYKRYEQKSREMHIFQRNRTTCETCTASCYPFDSDSYNNYILFVCKCVRYKNNEVLCARMRITKEPVELELLFWENIFFM